jgi:hypothetical protein
MPSIPISQNLISCHPVLHIYTLTIYLSIFHCAFVNILIFSSMSAWSTSSLTEYSLKPLPLQVFRDFNVRFYVHQIYRETVGQSEHLDIQHFILFQPDLHTHPLSTILPWATLFQNLNVQFHISLIYILTHWVFIQLTVTPSILIFNIWLCFSLIHRLTRWVFIQPSATPSIPTFNIWFYVSLICSLTNWVFMQPSATRTFRDFNMWFHVSWFTHSPI